MMTAGIAATSPKAVASSASAMPGATTARLVVCDFEMPIKLFMMPHTVPNSPTKGEVAPMVASSPMPSRIRRASARTISAKLDAARSLMPLSLEIPADNRASRIAAASSDDSTLSFAPSANCASGSDLASRILPRAARSLRWTSDSSIIFAMKMVQVTSEAKARPIITALTRISADRNIDHGDNSRSATAVDFSGLLPPSAAAGVPSALAGADGTTADGAGACTGEACVGETCVGAASGCDNAGTCGAGAVFCCTGDGDCADDGDGSDSIASAKITANVARKGDMFILGPKSGSDCNACIRSITAVAECRDRNHDAA